jgi:hypothetical protein
MPWNGQASNRIPVVARFSMPSRTALGSNQPSVQGIPGLSQEQSGWLKEVLTTTF